MARKGRGVRVVQSSASPSSIELNTSAAFQLLLLAKREQVRDAAATALAPLVRANPRMLRCRGGVRALPRWERTAALLVASLIERDPGNALRYGVLLPGAAKPGRDFRYSFAPVDGRRVDEFGLERLSHVRATFALPAAASQMFVRLANSVVRRPGHGTLAFGWDVGPAGVRICMPKLLKTQARSSTKLQLYTPEGRLLMSLPSCRPMHLYERWFEFDPGFLLRLASGVLRGHVLTLVHRARYARRDRAQDVVMSMEIGQSLDEHPVFSMQRGELSPRYDLGLLSDARTVELPLLAGATIGELDTIAQHGGVWHGSHLRGSFTYHPLRSCGHPHPNALQGVA